MHVNAFTNLLGEDKNGWGLSHKGLLWHDGMARNYTKRFKENQATKIGILFDGIAGTLTYYKDDVCLGIAFRGLNEVRLSIHVAHFCTKKINLYKSKVKFQICSSLPKYKLYTNRGK